MTAPAVTARPSLGELARWRTVDLVTAAMLGVAFGVAYWGWSAAYNVLSPAFTAVPALGGLLGGPWLLAGVVGGLVVRRPGAALLAELVAANVEYLLGNQWGVATLVSGLLQGLGVEIALAIFLFRRFGPWVAALGGALAAVLETGYEYVDLRLRHDVRRRRHAALPGDVRAVGRGAGRGAGLGDRPDAHPFRRPGGVPCRTRAGARARRRAAAGRDPGAVSGARVDVRGLTWRPWGRRDRVLDQVDLRLEPGERIVLAGPSGAGKSTLLRALAGRLSADDGELAGEVHVDGVTGLLLQDPSAAVVADRVGRDTAFGPENLALPRDDIWGRVEDSLRRSAFPYDTDRPTAALSGGEGQRLALAGALALRPGLLLLDEPAAMLDADNADRVRAAVLAVAERSGATLVVVEHRMAPWLEHVDRLVVLGSGGGVVVDGSPDRVLAEHSDRLRAAGLWVDDVPRPAPAVAAGAARRSARRCSSVTPSSHDRAAAAVAGRRGRSGRST